MVRAALPINLLLVAVLLTACGKYQPATTSGGTAGGAPAVAGVSPPANPAAQSTVHPAPAAQPPASVGGGQIDGNKLADEYIALAESAAGQLEKVTDAASAEAAGAKVQPMLSRQDELVREMAAFRLQASPEAAEQWKARYSSRIQAAGQRIAAAQARVLTNPQLLIAWGRGAQQAQAAAPAKPAAQDAAGAVEAFRTAAQNAAACYQRITTALNSITDDATARSAAPQLTAAASELKDVNQRLKLALVLVAQQPDARQRLEELGQSTGEAMRQMMAAMERVYPSPAGQTIKGQLRGLLDALLASATSGERKHLQKWIQQKKLDQ